jgi:hypothetical protein
MSKLLKPSRCSVWRFENQFRCDYEINGQILTKIEQSPLELESWMIATFGKTLTKNRIIGASEKDSNFWA